MALLVAVVAAVLLWGLMVVLLKEKPKSSAGQQQLRRPLPPATQPAEILAEHERASGAVGESYRKAIIARGLWCGGKVEVKHGEWDTSPNRQVYAVTCDDGKEWVKYRLTADRSNSKVLALEEW